MCQLGQCGRRGGWIRHRRRGGLPHHLISGNSGWLRVFFFTRLASDRLLLLSGVQTIDNEDPYKEKWTRPYLILARLYDLVIMGTTSVGYLVGGPYEGKKMVGCSRRRMSNTAGGVGRPSNSTAVAPTDMGNDRLLPSP